MVLERLADYVVSLDIADYDGKYTDAACICLLDAVECMFDTFEDNRTASALKYALVDDGPCTLFGRSEKSSVRGALIYNTVTGSVASRNDMNIEGNAHPATALVPLVLALGEKNHSSGKTVLSALAAGYEVLSRLGQALRTGGACIPKSLRPTSLCVAIASAFTASKMMGLDRTVACSAAALACNYVAGLNEWRFEGTGEDVFLNAFAAEFGLMCAELSAAGMRAASSNLEGEFGFLGIFGARENADLIVADLGDPEAIVNTRHKPVAACRALQGICLLADRILKENSFDVSEITEMELQVSSQIEKHVWYFRKDHIENLVQAILSMPFGLAATLVAGGHENIGWVPPYEGKVTELMSGIRVIFNSDFGRDDVRVTIRLSDGRRIGGSMEGFPFLSEEEILTYFSRRMPTYLGQEKAEEVVSVLPSIWGMTDIRGLISLLEV